MTHIQTIVQHDGEEIFIDEGIAELLQELWSAGIPTEFSCEGHPEWDAGMGCNCDHYAYIAFTSFSDAKRFLTLLWGITDCQLERWNGGASAVVRFDGADIDLILEALRTEVL